MKSQLKSLVSSFIVYVIQSRPGCNLKKDDPDLREKVEKMFDDLAMSLNPDPECWDSVKDKYFYDVYLQMREDMGTITELDKTRPKLMMAQFSNSDEWHRHCLRVSEHRASLTAAGEGGEKTCSACGQTKDISRFKKRGGSVCNACRGKAYRQRKAEAA